MRNWIHKITIRDISEYKDYDESKEKEQIPMLGKKMEFRLKKYSFIPKRFGLAFKKVSTCDGFNKVLDRLYDYCDANDIFVNF